MNRLMYVGFNCFMKNTRCETFMNAQLLKKNEALKAGFETYSSSASNK